MCILIAKHAGARKPSADELKNSAAANPDGCGMAWIYKGKLYATRTRDVEDIIALNERLDVRQPAIYHFRIATHGTVNLNNCHPFVSKDKRIAFAHNGILSVQNDTAKDWTDSETAFRYLFLPILKTCSVNSRQFASAIQCVIGNSKFAFLEAGGTLTTFGEFINDGGLLMSNTSYKPRPTFQFDKNWQTRCGNTSKPTAHNAEPNEEYYNQYADCCGELEADILNGLDGYYCDVTKQSVLNYAEIYYNDIALIYDRLTEEDIAEIAFNILEVYGINITDDNNGKARTERAVEAQV